jgi:hypothetical protein
MTSMTLSRADLERWLAAEASGRDGDAEQAFARVFGALPRIDPAPGFTDRVVRASVRAAARRRLLLRIGRLAASAATVAAGAVLSYLAVVEGGTWLVRTGAVLTVQAFSLVVRSAAEGLDWWAIVARVGAATGEALARPQISSIVLAVEVIGVAALYTLHRVLRADRDSTESREART